MYTRYTELYLQYTLQYLRLRGSLYRTLLITMLRNNINNAYPIVILYYGALYLCTDLYSNLLYTVATVISICVELEA